MTFLYDRSCVNWQSRNILKIPVSVSTAVAARPAPLMGLSKARALVGEPSGKLTEPGLSGGEVPTEEELMLRLDRVASIR